MMKLEESLQNVEKNIGKRIHFTRNMLGISRESLARSIGVTCQQVHKYESGVNRISISRLLIVAQSLGKSLKYFYSDTDKSEPLEGTEIPRENLILMKKLSKLQNKKQQKALGVLIDGLIS